MNCCREDEWSSTTRSREKMNMESKRTNAEQIENEFKQTAIGPESLTDKRTRRQTLTRTFECRR